MRRCARADTVAGDGIGVSLQAIARAGRTRELRATERVGRCRVRVHGREALSFASCDYLGLARHPRLAAAAAREAHAAGTSSGAARLLAGHDPAVEALEHELASTFQQPAALIFSSGYMANVGVATALAERGDLILSDGLSHASTVDACRLSRAEVRVLPHSDVEALRHELRDASSYRRVLVLVEGLYSMDGDMAPLEAMAEAARQAGAMLIIDDAHGLGTVGPEGRGAAAACGVSEEVAIQVGNLGKALGSFGAFVLTDERTRELLVQTSRSFIFTCSLPPPVVAAAREALAVLADEPERGVRLRRNAVLLRELLAEGGLEAPHGESPIVPVLVGADARAVTLAERLLARGFLVPAIRPPTVPEGGSRLRLSVTAEHTEDECRSVVTALLEELR